MRDVSQLHPKLRDKLETLKTECKKQGLKIGIGDCLRTTAEQDARYAKGRTEPGKVVTNAKGNSYSSMHQWGVAFDFFRNDGKRAYENSDSFFNKVGKIGKSIGLEWGGDWTSFIDLPHFQLPDWGSTASELKILYGKPEIFFKTWEENAMTQTEQAKFNALVNEVEQLAQRIDRVYHYTSELPDWARPTVQKLLDKGIYAGAAADDLNLPESLMRMLVINDRMGLYRQV